MLRRGALLLTTATTLAATASRAAPGAASSLHTLHNHRRPALSSSRSGTAFAQLEADASLDIFGRAAAVSADDDGLGLGALGRKGTESVVKVYSVHSSVCPQLPWTAKSQEESTGSGFCIEQNERRCILTNAHVVADATYVEVRKAGDARKYVATRLKVSHECDLATLTVDDESFWEGCSSLSFGSMPSLQDEVSVVGYPEGGEGVSVTVGVVSRIEIQRYAHSGANLLAIQIDAAINPGNSGGPALDEDGQVIGVAFQNQQESQNIGYVIPVPTISHFLDDTAPPAAKTAATSAAAPQGTMAPKERCEGFSSLGIYWQALDNEQLRALYGIDERRGQSGVLIRGRAPLSAAAGYLKRDDVLLELAGQRIANDGSFAVAAQERLSFQHLIHMRFPGEPVQMRVLRGKETLELQVPVQPLRRLVPATVYDEPHGQSYFVYGGFAFVPLSEPYLHEWGDEWQADAPQDLVHLAMTGVQTRPDEQVVVLSRCFPSKTTAGYSHMADRQVVSVNGRPVLNLRQMYALVQKLHAEEDYLSFEVFCVGGNAIVTTSTAAATETLEHTMQLYRIPAAASAELLDATSEEYEAALARGTAESSSGATAGGASASA